jgi:tetratricopeptide (TPR) repeat protein
MRELKRWRITWLIAITAALIAAAPRSRAEKLTDYERSGSSFQQALALTERGLGGSAIKLYEEAIRLDPAFVEAMVNLARLHLEKGKLQQASTWLDRAARVRPDYPDLYRVRGLIALAEERLQDALAAFGRARRLAPENVEVLTNLGATLVELGILGEARTVLEQAFRRGPARPEVALNLGIVWDRRGDPARAVYLYRRFLGLVTTDDPDRKLVEDRIAALEPHLLKSRAGDPEFWQGEDQ